MSNRQFSLTVKAIDIIDTIPKRSRSKFVSDAIINFIKKKGILDEYLIQKSIGKEANVKNKVTNTKTLIMDEEDNLVSLPKRKVKIDEDF